MTGDEFHVLGSRVWGRGYQARIAEALRVDDRQVRRWRSGATPISRERIEQIKALASDAEEQKRLEDAAYAYAAPQVDAIVAGALDHHEADVLAGILSRAVEVMRDRAGVPATIETLRQTIEALKRERDT